MLSAKKAFSTQLEHLTYNTKDNTKEDTRLDLASRGLAVGGESILCLMYLKHIKHWWHLAKSFHANLNLPNWPKAMIWFLVYREIISTG